MINFIANATAAVEASGIGGLFAHIDIGTLATAVVTLLLIAGGYHDRKVRKASGDRTCSTCMGPVLDRLESLLKIIQELLSKHAIDVDRHDAVDCERGKSMQKTLDAILADIGDLRRDLTGRK